MRRFPLPLLLIAITLIPGTIIAQDSAKADRYKKILDHLQSLVSQGETQWRVHDDVPHPEDPGLNDSDWNGFTVKHAYSAAGCRFPRRLTAMPLQDRGSGWISVLAVQIL
jgi:hypothetical protein